MATSKAVVPGECRWCGRKNHDDPSDYYHESDCWRRDVVRRKKEEFARHKREIADLEREYERAAYVGD